MNGKLLVNNTTLLIKSFWLGGFGSVALLIGGLILKEFIISSFDSRTVGELFYFQSVVAIVIFLCSLGSVDTVVFFCARRISSFYHELNLAPLLIVVFFLSAAIIYSSSIFFPLIAQSELKNFDSVSIVIFVLCVAFARFLAQIVGSLYQSRGRNDLKILMTELFPLLIFSCFAVLSSFGWIFEGASLYGLWGMASIAISIIFLGRIIKWITVIFSFRAIRCHNRYKSYYTMSVANTLASYPLTLFPVFIGELLGLNVVTEYTALLIFPVLIAVPASIIEATVGSRWAELVRGKEKNYAKIFCEYRKVSRYTVFTAICVCSFLIGHSEALLQVFFDGIIQAFLDEFRVLCVIFLLILLFGPQEAALKSSGRLDVIFISRLSVGVSAAIGFFAFRDSGISGVIAAYAVSAVVGAVVYAFAVFKIFTFFPGPSNFGRIILFCLLCLVGNLGIASYGVNDSYFSIFTSGGYCLVFDLLIGWFCYPFSYLEKKKFLKLNWVLGKGR